MTELICKIKDWAYDMQEMSYRENFFFRIARKNYLEKCLKQNRESEQIRGKAVSSRT